MIRNLFAASPRRFYLAGQLIKAYIILSSFVPQAVMVRGTDLAPGHWLGAALAVLLVGSILLRNWLRASRPASLSPVWQTVWVAVEQAVSLVAWGATGWALHAAPPAVMMASEATTVGWRLWRGALHFGISASLAAIPVFFWSEKIRGGGELVLVLPSLLMLYALTYTTEMMREEQEAVARARTEADLANAHLREYVQQVEELGALRERNRIAREVHDTIAHGFTGIIMQAEGIARIWHREPEAALAALAEVRDQARQSLNEVRRSVHALRPGGLEHGGGVSALKQLTDRFAQTTGIKTEFVVEGRPVELPAAHDLCFYRAVQEGLTNAFRHGRCQSARVLLQFAADEAALLVQDDGRGVHAPGGGGQGLNGIRERTEALGGTVVIGTPPGGGFSLRVLLPLRPTAAREGA